MMNHEQQQLYERIREHQLVHPSAQYPFSARLASENGWTADYAERVIQEYKRFAFLAVAAGHPVSPSPAVDQAWHLHLNYTRDYWDHFCAEVLKAPLHHQPTAGGPQERDKFADWYRQTLASYERLFGEAPPADIWPAPAQRFPLVPGRPMTWGEVAIVALCIVGYLTLSFAVRRFARWLEGPPPPPPKPVPLSPDDEALLWCFVIGFAATSLVAGVLRWSCRRPSGEPEGEELQFDPYESAYLAGGGSAARCAAVAALVGDGLLKVESSAEKLERPRPAPDVASRHVMEQAVWRAVETEQGASLPELHHKAEIPHGFDERLRAAGLVVGVEMAAIGRWLPLAIALLAPLFGLARMLGIPECEPTAVLIFPWLVATGLACGIFGRPLHRTRRGDRALAALKTKHIDLKTRFSAPDATIQSKKLAHAVGLFGVGILAGGPLKDLHALMKSHVNDDGAIWIWHESGESGDADGCGGGCGCG